MTTLTIELPETLTEQLQANGISPRQLKTVIIRLVQEYLHNYQPLAVTGETNNWSQLESLAQHPRIIDEADKLEQMARAVDDPLFMADLQETMSAFAGVDAAWWEPVE